MKKLSPLLSTLIYILSLSGHLKANAKIFSLSLEYLIYSIKKYPFRKCFVD